MQLVHSKVTIREPKVEEISLILEFIRKKAKFDNLLHLVETTEEMLRENMFGSNPSAHVLLADLNGQTVGFATYFLTFSSFLGCQGIWLDDLFVDEAARGKGAGKALLTYLASLATKRGYGRIEWLASASNHKALSFYVGNGAIILESSRLLRINRREISYLAQNETSQ